MIIINNDNRVDKLTSNYTHTITYTGPIMQLPL